MTAANRNSSGVATPMEERRDADPEPVLSLACCGRKRTQSMRERFFAWINGNRPGQGL
jgi:hypothetical protein